MTTTPQIPTSDSVRDFAQPAAFHDKAYRQGRRAATAMRTFVKHHPKAICAIEGKKYPCVELWQFVGACFGCTGMITSTQELLGEKSESLGFLATASIRNHAGEYISSAEAVCMREESDWQTAPVFQLRSMAQTRAEAKAFRMIFSYIMVMAGLSPTPAEEMAQGGLRHFDQGEKLPTGTPCYDCGEHRMTAKRSAATKKKYGKALCLECEQKLKAAKEAEFTSTVTGPDFVAASVAAVQAKKTAQGQPIVEALDAGQEEIG